MVGKVVGLARECLGAHLAVVGLVAGARAEMGECPEAVKAAAAAAASLAVVWQGEPSEGLAALRAGVSPTALGRELCPTRLSLSGSTRGAHKAANTKEGSIDEAFRVAERAFCQRNRTSRSLAAVGSTCPLLRRYFARAASGT